MANSSDAVRTLAGSIVLASTVLLSFSQGDAPNMIFMKTLAAQLLLLAHPPIDEGSGGSTCSWQSVRYQLRESLAICCWLGIVLWQPEVSVTLTAAIFFVGLVGMTATRCLLNFVATREDTPRMPLRSRH